MKKIILLALTDLMMVGCDYTPTDHTTTDGKRVVKIYGSICDILKKDHNPITHKNKY